MKDKILIVLKCLNAAILKRYTQYHRTSESQLQNMNKLQMFHLRASIINLFTKSRSSQS